MRDFARLLPRVRKSARLLLIAVSLCFLTAALSAEPLHLYPVYEGGKAAFINNRGAVVLRSDFDDAMGFSDGLAAVRCGSKWGFIDTTGALVIDCRFSGPPWGFRNGMAVIKEGESRDARAGFGYVDKSGSVVIPFKFDVALSFSEDLAAVGIAGRFHFIDKRGRQVFDAEYDDAGPFSEGAARIEKSGLVGFIDHDGATLITPSFRSAGDFHEGLAAASKDGKKSGYINRKGAFVIKPEFDEAMAFSEGLAPVRIGYKWGYIDKSGTRVIQEAYWSARNFSYGLAAVAVGRSWGYINRQGRMTVPRRFSSASMFDAGGVASVWLAPTELVSCVGCGRHAYIDRSGKYIWGPR